jgi:hypothetical protein
MERRTYIDPTGTSVLFYNWNPLDEGWYPDMELMGAWDRGDVWTYRPLDHPEVFVTAPCGRVWPLMTVEEANAIRVWPAKPWISGGCVIDYYPLEALTQENRHASENDGLLALALAASDSTNSNSESNSWVGANAPPLPPHIVATLLRCAQGEGLTCSITMEPITVTDGTVTPCGHYFQAAALGRWVSEHGTCPECRCALR